jgi:hypothetical protein
MNIKSALYLSTRSTHYVILVVGYILSYSLDHLVCALPFSLVNNSKSSLFSAISIPCLRGFRADPEMRNSVGGR